MSTLVLPRLVMPLYEPNEYSVHHESLSELDEWVFDPYLDGYNKGRFAEELPNTLKRLKETEMCTLGGNTEGPAELQYQAFFSPSKCDGLKSSDYSGVLMVTYAAIMPYHTQAFCRLVIDLLFNTQYVYIDRDGDINRVDDYFFRKHFSTKFRLEDGAAPAGFLDLDNLIFMFPTHINWTAFNGDEKHYPIRQGQTMFQRAVKLYVEKREVAVRNDITAEQDFQRAANLSRD